MTTAHTPTLAAQPVSAPPHTPAAQPLQAHTFPLWGSRLIEASAGTGKTWTIAALYLRLVLGHGGDDAGVGRPLAPPDILVMTFTRAATRELSERIRSRLVEAARCFRGEQAVPLQDPLLQQLLDDHPPGPVRQQAAWRLALAAEGMDAASIHTIDAWCQRMLREHALDSGSLFDEELLPDERALRLEAVQDFWRTALYPLPTPWLSGVLAIWKDIASLQADVSQLLQLGLPLPASEDGGASLSLPELLAQWAAPLQPLWAEPQARVARLVAWWQAQQANHPTHWNGNKLRPATVQKWWDALAQWAEQPLPLALPDIANGLMRLTADGLQDARTKKAPPFEPPPDLAWLEAVLAQLAAQPLAPVLRRHAAVQVAQRLADLKRRGGVAGFADWLQRLHDALSGPHGDRLRARVLAQFPVALIDEFQDTSPLQYRLFDLVYGVEANPRDRALLLIGDPKQSIYGFRGADIHSYLEARRATAGRHYVLTVNHRSTAALVGAVNHCFAQAEASQPQAAFRFQTPEGNPLPFWPVSAQGRAEQLVNATGPLPALTLVHDLELASATAHRRRFAARCAERIATWLNDPALGFESRTPVAGLQRLRPRDIAVLVRTGKEAAAVRAALQRRGVASVYLSEKDSVFDSPEARDLVHWLHGVAAPNDATRVRAALATASMGLTLAELHTLATDDEAFDLRSQHLAALLAVWRSQGVLAMLRQSLHGAELGLASRWLGQPDGERRLTNLLHLAELLQAASTGQAGEARLIRWLERQIAEHALRGDEQVVRLESDADLVKVVTLHKSKGLEYPVVCLPFATSFRAVDARSTTAVRLPGAQGQAQVVLELDAEALAVADTERLREDLRLLYVGLTRPRHAVWVGFAALRVGTSPRCQTHRSALGALLGGDPPVDGGGIDWAERLQALAQTCLDIELHTAEAEHEMACTALRSPEAPLALRDAPRYSARFERDWTIASYSRLTRDLKAAAVTAAMSGAVRADEQAPAASPLLATQPMRPADDEWSLPGEADHPVEPGAVPGQPALAPASATVPVAAAVAASGPVPAPEALPIWHAFARGPLSGHFLHDQLEWLAGERFDLAGQPDLARRLALRCERAGHGARATEVVQWLQAVVHTPLAGGTPAIGPGVALAELHTLRPELEFWLPAQRLSATTIDALCQAHCLPGVPRPALAAGQLHGMLMGFADLVFEHAGRYWVLDYKSNHLGSSDAAYTPAALRLAMAQHRYDVQAALYLLALHRLLRQRLGAAYRPRQHLGGAVYFFVRGLHGPSHGLCVLPAHEPLLDALDAMLAGDTDTDTGPNAYPIAQGATPGTALTEAHHAH